MPLTLADIRTYFAEVSASHRPTPQQGFEIHDRGIFIRRLLGPLGYSDTNLLQDVAQSVDGATRTPDIRIYGNDEVRSKQAHSQFVVETKNYDLYAGRLDAIDLLQLKRYIIYNRSRVRVIVATDFVTLVAFNATRIRSEDRLRISAPDSINESERKLFRENILFTVRLDSPTPDDVQRLSLLSHALVFEKHQFRNPQDTASTCDIADGDVRGSFLVQLFHKTRSAEEQLRAVFLPLADVAVSGLAEGASQDSPRHVLNRLFGGENGAVLKSYLLWAAEMGYLPPFLTQANIVPDWVAVRAFLRNREHRTAFVAASVYSLINKTFFLRTLEDSQTANTQFIRGEQHGRYLSDGVLQQKYDQGVPTFVGYVRDLFQFRRDDLLRYQFLLHRDIFSWVLDKVDAGVLIDLIRLFNDLNFRKLNQDILGDIYEHYLEQDRAKGEKSYRQLLGQYYTPKPIVRLMWLLVRNLLHRASGRDLHEANKPYLNVLDPCYGSGTFLTEGILQINASALKKSINVDGRVFGFVRDRGRDRRVEDSLTGFELNPLSKGIADVNLYFALIQAYGAEVLATTPIERLRLFRTNSYQVGSGQAGHDIEAESTLFLFSEDVQRALLDSDAIKQAKRAKYDIIIANPPYGDVDVTPEMRSRILPFAYAANNYDAAGTLVDFEWTRTAETGQVPTQEKNRGKLKDMYAFFFGVADRMLGEGGILAFITANTWLTIPTYKFFRRYYLQNYTIDTVINFNNISDRVSMFAPDAGIATAIVVMRKCRPEAGHKIRFLDLSEVPTIKGKFDAFCTVKWRGEGRDRRDILNFEVKPMSKLGFVEVEQATFLEKPDYMLRVSREEGLVAKLEDCTVRLSEMLPSNQGVDVGDLEHLVASDPATLRHTIEEVVFTGKLDDFGKTSKGQITQALAAGRIDCTWDAAKLLPFVFQKDMQRWEEPPHHWVYMDHHILWRSRTQQNGRPSTEIFEREKLFVLERRESSQLVSLVTEEACAPQHGGRFFYFVARNGATGDDLHTVCAMLNSSPINYYYRVKSQGNKDVRLRRLSDIPPTIRASLAEHSRVLHGLRRDCARLERGQFSSFETEFVRENIAPLVQRVHLLDGSPFWRVEMDGTLPDCWVDGASIAAEDPAVVVLNENARLHCRDASTAAALVEGALRGFSGDLLQQEVVVDLATLTSDGEVAPLEALIDDESDRRLAAIDDLVCEVYGLTAEESRTIRETVGGR